MGLFWNYIEGMMAGFPQLIVSFVLFLLSMKHRKQHRVLYAVIACLMFLVSMVYLELHFTFITNRFEEGIDILISILFFMLPAIFVLCAISNLAKYSISPILWSFIGSVPNFIIGFRAKMGEYSPGWGSLGAFALVFLGFYAFLVTSNAYVAITLFLLKLKKKKSHHIVKETLVLENHLLQRYDSEPPTDDSISESPDNADDSDTMGKF